MRQALQIGWGLGSSLPSVLHTESLPKMIQINNKFLKKII
ncbi:MAG: hypothetical protein ON057_000023 [Glomeribacter sp. 1016415]|nr:hypothetical protein [Glomeribacter sp. 1016415]